MPEGDTVWLAARRLHAALAGEVLTRSDLRVPRFATVDLSGRRVLEVVSRGKHLLVRVAGGLTVHSHLKMEGAWRVFAAGERWRGGPDWQVRAVLANARRVAVGYRLGLLEVVPTPGEDRVVGHLGPDLLGEDWDPAEAARRIAGQPERAIGEALLDQRNLAGIGTLWRAETLFLRGVHPATPVAATPDLLGLVDLAHRLLLASRDQPSQVTTGVDRPGERTWVFERAGRGCRRCGTRIARGALGQPGTERVSYWCPRCQPAALATSPQGEPASFRRAPPGSRR